MSELLAHLDTLAEGARAMLWAGFLVFVRVGAMMALLPAFGEQMVPPRVRLVVTLAFTAVVAPVVFPALPDAPGVLAVLAEAVVGLMLG
ncbi:MAG: flagellar biosynthetic protein FliR, partial [Gemmobacter sp.]